VVVELVVAELVEVSKRPLWGKVLWRFRQAQPPDCQYLKFDFRVLAYMVLDSVKRSILELCALTGFAPSYFLDQYTDS